ncbi:MAG: tetratricopeptide repeat protein, partial [Gemmatimonadetes bacterium]|nr:tetratricopeptide repeat protein [Gemmatimonadota bacterium]NIQ54087.1 tetratricopeptide repeat protein [Gemmatimonadota bacterium]NIU74281.1 tetratricopeptide repeat protein [Gammaproteobacteria bacterium]NIX44297.1 tetratricopeptide repeat protein [Gemmatimonadota bacterium]NIY08514.1 tetratricopeptide repeat protein [Gemmatimonadota bacterium]
ARLLELDPDNLEGRLHQASALAWAGRHGEAIAAVSEVRDRDPANREALLALARFNSWAGRYDESLRYYDALLADAPDDPELRRARAAVLGWAGRHDEAADALRELAARDPSDVETRLALARVLAWEGRYRQAETAFRAALELDPDNLEARRGLARVAGWSGQLREGERRWRDVLTAYPDDVDALVGLAANLRWQGRPRAAVGVLDRAEALAPDHADVETQRLWLDAAVGPRLAPSFLYESDSDGNRAETVRLEGAWLVGGVGLQLTADARWFDEETVVGRESSTRSADLALGLGLGRGWTLTGGGGVRTGDGDTQETLGLWRLGLASPAYLPVSGSLVARRSAFDYTALLAQRNVAVEELALSLAVRPEGSRVTAGVRGGAARFEAAEDNRRWLLDAHVTYRPLPPLSVGVRARAFGFSEDVDEGYWDPSLYRVIEAPVALSLDGSPLFARLEVAPGYQAIEHAAVDVDNAALRAAARVGIRLAPGRQVGLSASLANSGLQRVSPVPDSDYEYRAISVFIDWSLR